MFVCLICLFANKSNKLIKSICLLTTLLDGHVQCKPKRPKRRNCMEERDGVKVVKMNYREILCSTHDLPYRRLSHLTGYLFVNRIVYTDFVFKNI